VLISITLLAFESALIFVIQAVKDYSVDHAMKYWPKLQFYLGVSFSYTVRLFQIIQ